MASSSMDYSYFTNAPMPYPYFPTHLSEIRDDSFPYPDFVPPTDYPNSFIPPPEQPSYDYTPAPAQRQPSTRPSPQSHLSQGPVSPGQSYDPSYRTDLNDELQRQRSSSEEKELATPQQNKRKAQNRAAQRAFRERKEKHLKDLEAKLADVQKQSMSLDSENEKLKKEIAKLATENEILKATNNGQIPSGLDGDDLSDPLGFRSSANLGKGDISFRAKFNPLQPIIIDDTDGEPLLSARHTWDYIQAHDLFRKELIDVGDVCERLKKLARCNGQGPVFRESDIRKAIDESAVAGGRDELI